MIYVGHEKNALDLRTAWGDSVGAAKAAPTIKYSLHASTTQQAINTISKQHHIFRKQLLPQRMHVCTTR